MTTREEQHRLIHNYLVKAQDDMTRRAQIITSVCEKWNATDHPMYKGWSAFLRSNTIIFRDGEPYCGWAGDEVINNRAGWYGSPDWSAMNHNKAMAQSLADAKSDRDIASVTRNVLREWFTQRAAQERAEIVKQLAAKQDLIRKLQKELDAAWADRNDRPDTGGFGFPTPMANAAKKLAKKQPKG